MGSSIGATINYVTGYFAKAISRLNEAVFAGFRFRPLSQLRRALLVADYRDAATNLRSYQLAVETLVTSSSVRTIESETTQTVARVGFRETNLRSQ